MRQAFNRSLTLTSALSMAPAALAQMGGLYLPESGGPASGTALAGQAAVARDAQTAWLNPAGLTRLDSSEILVSAMPFYLGLEFDSSPSNTVPGSDGGQQGGWLPGAGLFLAVPISERFVFGFSVTAPAGLILDPSNDWVGRTYLTEATVAALNFQPSLGFRINDHFSIGAGLDIQYATLEMDIGLPGGGGPIGLGGGTANIDGDNWEVGFSVGLLWEPLETTRFGLRYRSTMDHDLDGDFTVIAGGRSASTGLELPQSVALSAYHDVTDQFAILADVGWTNWNAFSRTVINTDPFTASIPRNWQDTWNFGLGAHFRPVDNWLIMMGAHYVTSAVEDEDRTPDLPSDAQFRASVGLEYEVNERIRVGGTFTYLYMGSNQIDQDRGTGRVVGSYDANAFLIGLYASFQF